MTHPNNPVIGVFTDHGGAQRAVKELLNAGFSENQVGVLAPRVAEWKKETAASENDTQWEDGALAGGVTGAGVGGLWALGIVAGVLPALGPVVAGGVLASVLASAASGAAVGSLLGALLGLGVSEEDARHYEEEFKAGRTLVTVRAEGHYADAVAVLQRCGGSVRAETNVPRAVVSPMAGSYATATPIRSR